MIFPILINFHIVIVRRSTHQIVRKQTKFIVLVKLRLTHLTEFNRLNLFLVKIVFYNMYVIAF